MSDLCFLDTNVLVYAYDSSDANKQATAKALIEDAVINGNLVISPQVLGEFFVTVTRKIPAPLSADEASELITIFVPFATEAISAGSVVQAVKYLQKYKLSYWDALVIASAKQADCRTLFSEDLQDGQKIDSLVIKNPFSSRTATY